MRVLDATAPARAVGQLQATELQGHDVLSAAPQAVVIDHDSHAR